MAKFFRRLGSWFGLVCLGFLGCGGGIPEDQQACGVLDGQGNVQCGYQKPVEFSCPEGTIIVNIDEVDPCAVEL